MKNSKFSVMRAVLLLGLVVAGAISIYSGDELAKNLKTAVIGDYGYSSQPINYQARNFFCYPGPLQPNDGSKYGGSYNTYMYNYGEAYANSGVKGTWCTNYLPSGDASLMDDPPLKTSTTNAPTDHASSYINSAVYRVTDPSGQEDTSNVMYRRWQSHVNHAKIHENKVVFYENTLSGYGAYYKTGTAYGGSGGLDPNGSGIYGNSVVHCPAGAVVVDHSTTASQYKAAQSSRHYGSSPTQEDGLYDGGGHKWCELNGVAVNPVMGPDTGKSMPDFASDKSMLFKFTFPNGSGGSADYFKYHNTWNSLSVAAANSDWVKCEYGIAGPFVEGTNNHYISPYDSQSNQNKAKTPHYHCLSQNGSGYTEPVKDTVGPQSPFNTWTFLSGIMYSENTCTAGDASCGGAGTIAAPAPCSRGTYYYQTTEAGYRRCLASATPDADTFKAPLPSWTLGDPTNLYLSSAPTDNKYKLGDSIIFVGSMVYSGTGFPSISSKFYTVKVSASPTDFSNPVWQQSYNSNSNSTILSATYTGTSIPVGGPYYFCMKVEMKNDNSFFTTSGLGDQITSCKVSDKTFTVIAAPVNSCALTIKLNDNKTTYAKGDMVNYTYSCTPVGTKAPNVTVQVVKPDGTATTYNSGTNIDTATLGFSTSNLDAGNYILRACLNSTCTSGISSVNFTVGSSSVIPPAMTLSGTIFKDGQYVDPVTLTLRNCVSPNAWMKEGTNASGARTFHCMPNYTATSYDNPPATCTGTLWAGFGGGSSTTPMSPDYCAVNKDSGGGDVGTGPKACGIGEKCASGSWCSNGKQCYYPDGNLTCAAWTMGPNNSCSVAAPGTKECSPKDTNCIEPGETGTLTGWCSNSMECFTSDGNKKFCQPYSNSPGVQTSCPAGSKLCAANDTNCIEPGSTGPVGGWCKNSQECFSKDGGKKYCNPWPENMMATMGNLACPAEYPKECRPSDKNCVEVGDFSKNPGAWCAPGGKQCYLGDGALFCADEKDGCPKDSKKCPVNFSNPVAYSPLAISSQCIEDEGPIDGWCGAGTSVQCYNSNGKTKKCIEVNTFNDPAAWESVSCPSGYDRCMPNSKGCLGYLGAKGKTGDWCAIGMTKDNGDGTVTCVAGKDWIPNPVVIPPVCDQKTIMAFDPISLDCKTFASSCDIPKLWQIPNDGRICEDGKLVELGTIKGDDVSMKKILEEKRKYLKDMELRLIALPPHVVGIELVKTSILEAEKTIKSIYQLFPTKSETDRNLVRDKINNLIKDILPAIESKMNSLNVYVEYSYLAQEIGRDLQRYRMILAKVDALNDYYDKLKEGVSRLESLMETAKTANGEVLDQLIPVIKTQWKDLQSLEDSHVERRGNQFVSLMIDDLTDALERFEVLLDEKNIEDSKITYLMEKFRIIVGNVSSIDIDEEISNEDLRMVDEAVWLKGRLENWLKPYGLEGGGKNIVSIENFMDLIDQKVTEAVNKAFEKFDNKLQLMMDEKLKEITVKFTELTEKVIEKFSEKFADQVAQNTNNLSSVPEEQKAELADATTRILDRTEALVDSVDASELSSFEKEGLMRIMEKIATHIWCGDYSQKIQSELNSRGLALEADRLSAAEVADFDSVVENWIVENNQECYKVGATPGVDVSMESWYHPYTMYNYSHGYMRGYGGDMAGNFGPANATLRIEALAMIMRLLDIPEGDASILNDEVRTVQAVPDWGIGYVNGAKGFLNKKWNMSVAISRAETAKLFVDAMSSLAKLYIDLPTVIDDAKKYTDYAKFAGDRSTAIAIEALTDAGIFKGGGDGGFHPYDSLLRSEFAAINQRVVETFDVEK